MLKVSIVGGFRKTYRSMKLLSYELLVELVL